MRTLGIVAAVLCCLLVLLVLTVPWGLYELGLSNIEGRPTPVAAGSPTVEDDLLLRRAFRTSGPISVQPLSPWSYARDLVTSGDTSSSLDTGEHAAWLIARHYNSTHLKNRRTIWGHLSGAALTIWITRNWTSGQVVSTAADFARQNPERHSRGR